MGGGSDGADGGMGGGDDNGIVGGHVYEVVMDVPSGALVTFASDTPLKVKLSTFNIHKILIQLYLSYL